MQTVGLDTLMDILAELPMRYIRVDIPMDILQLLLMESMAVTVIRFQPTQIIIQEIVNHNKPRDLTNRQSYTGTGGWQALSYTYTGGYDNPVSKYIQYAGTWLGHNPGEALAIAESGMSTRLMV